LSVAACDALLFGDRACPRSGIEAEPCGNR